MRPSVMPDSIAATIELTIDAVTLVLQPAIDCIAFAIQTGVDTVAAVIESCGQRIATLDSGVIGSAIETRVHRARLGDQCLTQRRLGVVEQSSLALQLRDLAHTGAIVGRLSAWGTAGGIAGTFLAGYVLVAFAAVTTLIVTVGVLLAIGIIVLVAVGIVVPATVLGVREWTKLTETRGRRRCST